MVAEEVAEMNGPALHRGPDGEMRLTVWISAEHGDLTPHQITVTRRTVLMMLEDGARMVREDEAQI